MLIDDVKASARVIGFDFVIFNALLEVLGEDATTHLFSQADFEYNGNVPLELAPDDFLSLCGSIIAEHGEEVGKGIIIRIGRAFFIHALREMASLSLLADSTYRLLPWRHRLDRGLETVAAFIEGNFPVSASVSRRESGIRSLTVRTSGSNEKVCVLANFLLGFVQEMLYVISNGRVFMVSVVDDLGCDDACILIEEQPIY